MQVIFQSPEWIVLIPVLALAGWFWKRLELWRPLRVLCLLLMTAILMRPQTRLTQQGIDLWVLLDRSESTENLVDADLPEWRKLLEKSKPSRHDDLYFVDYAADVIRQDLSDPGGTYAGARHQTRTALALENTLAMIKTDKPSRMLIFSDGYGTEPLGDLGNKLAEQKVPLDYRIIGREGETDYRVSRLKLPPRVQLAEPFLIDLEVRGETDGEVPVIIYRNGQVLTESKVEVSGGAGVLRFMDRIPAPGAYRYKAVIAPSEELDAYAGNNEFETWIEIVGGPRILLITNYTDDPVAKALAAQGFTVDTVMDTNTLAIGQLSGCRAVMLNNVPAHEIPGEFLASLDFFVRQQGGGLLMAGGKKSFGAGGYFDSAVDALLPVSMELKTEHRKLAVAMAIVMDRSGSMGAGVAGGRTKMDLANEGAARAVDLLSYQDMITVFAVDSEPDKVVGLSNVGEKRKTITRRVRRVRSGGGGIYVYTGLKAAWKELQKAEIGLRHIILFSDARDSEEPGDYKELIKDIVKQGGSVSVIGLGTDADVDAEFLRDIAKRGNGRIFFTEKAGELPNIFAQETVTVARSAFVTDPTMARETGRWFEIASGKFDWMDKVDGYNLSYLRPKDSEALITQDDYAAPLVAFGIRGVGRSAAVSFPLGGEHSETVRQWPKYGDFMQTLSRWLMGEDLPPGLGMRSRLDGTRLTVDLLYDDTWEAKFANAAPKILLGEGERAENQFELVWTRQSPGHYSASVDLEEGRMIRGAVQVGKSAIPFGPVVVGNRTEWAFDPERRAELKAVAAMSGGAELLELGNAWKRPKVKEFADIRHTLLLALFAMILLDALITRMGWKLPSLAFAAALNGRRASRRDRARQAEAAAQSRAEAEAVAKREAEARKLRDSPIAPTPEELLSRPKAAADTAESRRSRFKRAKRGGK